MSDQPRGGGAWALSLRSAVVVDLYRRWGAAIANANANLRLTRLENLYA